MCKRYSKEIKELFSHSPVISNKIFTYDQIKDLPSPIQRYFKYALPENFPYISYVRFKHGGQFKLNDKWTSIKGEEYFTTEKPGFIWIAKVPFIIAKDSYINGMGNLKVKLFSLFKIVDAKGAAYNQGELLRWLGEIPCAPTTLLPSDKLLWEAIDDYSAKVILTDNDLTVEGIFHVNDLGEITHFKAKRYKDNTSLEDWTGTFSDYRSVDGVKVPFYIEATWNLSSGDLTYVKFSLETIEFNIPSRF